MTQDEINKLWLTGENHPLLLQPTKTVEDFSYIQALAKHMLDIMERTNGVGLSANQIGLDLRMFVMRAPPTDTDVGGPRIVVNPDIVNVSDATSLYEEGCLSFPGLYFWVSRPTDVTVEYQDQQGAPVQTTLTGWPSRIFQHEYDHMAGITFQDHASRLKLERAEKKRRKLFSSIARSR